MWHYLTIPKRNQMKQIVWISLFFSSLLVHANEVETLQKGCEANDMKSCTQLGEMYELGDGGLTQTYPKALSFYSKACEGGNADGCTNLGNMYEHGKGIKEDADAAEKLYEKGCDDGSGTGCYKLGVMYYERLSPNQSTAVVRNLFREACALGEVMGCVNHRILQKSYRHFDDMQ
jgi:TPR repeat protein